jgi:hypothetical protein
LATGLTFDAGALIAAEKGSRRFWALWKTSIARRADLTVPAPVVAQVWRGNRPVIARLLQQCRIDVLDEQEAKRVGVLLAAIPRSRDVVDASVVVGASRRGDAILTSDSDDIERLVAGQAVALCVVPV